MTATEGDHTGGWGSLDAAWTAAFDQAWEAVRTGNIGVGAAVTGPDGALVAVARNRVTDDQAPSGQVAGTGLAHAEINALAQLRFRAPRDLVLTTTLQPCLQCSAAIRMGPVASIRIAGADPIWDGCHDFTGLTPWLARRAPVPCVGPRADLVGLFGTLLARLGPGTIGSTAEALRDRGEGPLLDLVDEIQRDGRLHSLLPLEVPAVFAALRDDLSEVRRLAPHDS
ncbi:MAG: hypothetical protein ACXIVQ_13225 [Acidimicrobiales bacterium]